MYSAEQKYATEDTRGKITTKKNAGRGPYKEAITLKLQPKYFRQCFVDLTERKNGEKWGKNTFLLRKFGRQPILPAMRTILNNLERIIQAVARS